MITKIRNYIITGLIVALPLVVSIAITIWLFKIITSGIINILPSSIKANLLMRTLIRLIIPLVLLVLLAFVGMFTKVVFIRKIFSLGEKLLIRIPLFNKIYISVKQMSHAFLSHDKTVFSRVVLVEYPRKGVHCIGFVTSKAKGEIQDKTREEVINVFVPTTPNPTSGMLIFASQKELIELNMSVEDGMKMVISGGAIVPPYITK